MRLLFLSRWYPFPTDNGSKLRIYNLLRGLAKHHEITLLSFADQPDADPQRPELRSLCSQIRIVPWIPFKPHSRRARLGLFGAVPRSLMDTYSQEMARQVEQALASTDFDLIIASQVQAASYAPHFAGVNALFEEIELGVFFEQYTQAPSLSQRLRYGLTWYKQRRYLSRLLKSFQACTVVSDREKALLAGVAPEYKSVEVIPNCINLADYAGVRVDRKPDTLVFTGSFQYHANYDAVCWFVQDILPRIQAQLPDVALTVTGDPAGRSLPPGNNVALAGFVDDVRPVIASAGASIAPLRMGGGTRLKILEAMALGTPVVATVKGAEGLDVRNGEHLLIADTPGAFAEAVVRLLREPDYGQYLTKNAYRLVSTKYDWSAVMPKFFDLVERTATASKKTKEAQVND